MITIFVNGRRVSVTEGMSVAAAVLNLDETDFRTSVGGLPRGPLCGMGICFECRLTVNDVPYRRSCLLPVEDGMEVKTD